MSTPDRPSAPRAPRPQVLAGQTAIVTGAGSGIGRSVVIELAAASRVRGADLRLQPQSGAQPGLRFAFRGVDGLLDLSPGAAARHAGGAAGWPAAAPSADALRQADPRHAPADPAASALDLDCRSHEVDNLYVVDSSFFPSASAVNPTLTVIANVIRVADHLKARLGLSEPAGGRPAPLSEHAVSAH